MSRIELSDRDWIEVEEKAPGVFKVVDNNMIDDWNVELSFCEWDREVENLDDGNNDESQCFGWSTHLRWQDVDMTLDEFTAPSIERLKEALSHVEICAWCPDDI